MRTRRTGKVGAVLAMALMTLATLGVAAAQDAKGPDARDARGGKGAPARGKNGNARNPRLPRVPPNRGRFRENDDQLLNPVGGAANAAKQEPISWQFRYKLRIQGTGGEALPATYYPAQLGIRSPVILMVHERDQTSRDFEMPIDELKGLGMAEYLQHRGFAVLLVDLHNVGEAGRAGRGAANELQAAYQFLLDRHNHGELNVAQLGVLAMGEGANLAAAWAAAGGAVSTEGRFSDLAALVLVSPLADAQGLRLPPALAALAPRVPLFLVAGDKDRTSGGPVQEARPVVLRLQRSKVELFPTSLHGARLVRFFPKVPTAIALFFESTIRLARGSEWEPRYNKAPTVNGVELIQGKPVEAREAKAEPAAQKKEAAPAAGRRARREE